MDITDMVMGIITAVGTVALLVLAVYGLSSWHGQFIWRENHELAKRLLINLYKVRDMISGARNPFVNPGEADEPNSDKWESGAYGKRWSRVTAAQVELDVAMTEANVVWGKHTPLDLAERSLRQHVGKLFIAIRHYLNNDGPNEGLFSEGDRDVLYATSDRSTERLDDYDTELDRIIGEYEKYLEQYLGRK
jgi:hypothetical protein